MEYSVLRDDSPSTSPVASVQEEESGTPRPSLLVATKATFKELPQADLWSCVSNLTSTIIGAGVLGLPSAFASNGYALGAGFLILSGACSAFGLHLLSISATLTGLPASFYSVANASVPKWTFLIDLAVAVKCFGVATSYLIVVGDLMPTALQQIGAPDGVWTSRQLWVFIGFASCAPLTLFKKLDHLKITSALSLLLVLFLAIIVVGYSIPSSSLDPCENIDADSTCKGDTFNAKFDLDTLKVLPVFIFGFTCQQNIFSVNNELKRPTRRRIDTVIVASVGIALVTYLIVAIAGFSTYGSHVESDILESYPQTSLLTGCRICVSAHVAFNYPLQAHPSRNSLLTLWKLMAGDPTSKGVEHFRFFVVTAAFLGLSLLLALTVKDLGVMLALVGATGSTMVSYILPGIVYYTLHKRTNPHHWKTKLALVQFIAGCFIMPVCLVIIFL